MTAATTTTPAAHAATERPSALATYRDDGPIARALGRLLGKDFPAPAWALVMAAVLPLAVALLVVGGDPDQGVPGAVLPWIVVIAGVSSGRPQTGRFAWLVPGLLRFAEYGAILWIGAVEGDGVAAGFALCAALAFRHYDLVYRLRHRGATPPRWVDLVGLGWDGRILLAYVFMVTNALPAGYLVVAAVFAVVFVGESVVSWTGTVRLQTAVYEEEEDEGQ